MDHPIVGECHAAIAKALESLGASERQCRDLGTASRALIATSRELIHQSRTLLDKQRPSDRAPRHVK